MSGLPAAGAQTHQRLLVLDETDDPGGFLVVRQVVGEGREHGLVVFLRHRLMSREKRLGHTTHPLRKPTATHRAQPLKTDPDTSQPLKYTLIQLNRWLSVCISSGWYV